MSRLGRLMGVFIPPRACLVKQYFIDKFTSASIKSSAIFGKFHIVDDFQIAQFQRTRRNEKKTTEKLVGGVVLDT